MPLPSIARVLFVLAASWLFAAPIYAQNSDVPLKIGIIGTGKIGSALARHWAEAGYEVFVSSRHPEELQSLVAEIGTRAHAGTPRQAAAFGTVVVVSIPYGAMPQIGEELRAELAGKVILDTSNPFERRDGPMALDAQRKGAGVATAEFLHSRRVVRAFNCISAGSLANEGNRQPERLAIPIGSDDAAALEIAERLVKDAGFDPVVVGSLAQSREFDLGQPLASGSLTAAELRKRIGELPREDLQMAPAASVGMSKIGLDRLRAAMQALVDDGRRAGIVYAVARKDKIVALEAYGKRSLERDLPMQTDTVFRLASLSRVLSGASFLTLLEDGSVRLDDPVAKFIPEFGSTPVIKDLAAPQLATEPQRGPMTVRHLLTYTSGLGYAFDWPKSYGMKQDAILSPTASLADDIKKLAGYPLLLQPGSKWHYGFSGDVLGRVAEVASGQRLDEFLRTRMFDKLGMKDTGFWTRDPKRLADVYGPGKSGKVENLSAQADFLSNYTAPGPLMSAGGGLVSTVPDYLRFAQMLLNGGQLDGVRVLKPETVKAMLTRQTTPEQGLVYWYAPTQYPAFSGYAWGYAIGIRVDGTHHVAGTSGDAGWAGFTNTWFFIDPAKEIAAVAMTQYLGPDEGAPVITTLRQGVYDALL
jgi:CubicO group peptidase (beta-lactamase class C family)/predicted dinucleotide-binding enzyme